MDKPLPPHSFLSAYHAQGSYTDCLIRDVPGSISLSAYLTAFYNSLFFRPERVILSLLLSMKATNADVAQLAEGTTERFSAWTVERRDQVQILLCDFQSRTRSWLMVEPLDSGMTRLYFGTAITPVDRTKSGRAAARVVFWALLWFHKIYARALIWSAAKRL